MRDLLFGVVWTLSLPLSFISPQAGVLMWIWVALISPNSMLFGMLNGVPFNKVVAISSLLTIWIGKERKDFYLDKLVLAMLALAVWCTICAWTALVPGADNDDLWQKLVKEVVLAVMITGVSVTRYRIHMICLVLAITLGFFGVFEGAVSILTAGGHKILGSPGIGDNNSLALALVMVAPMTYYAAQYSAVRLVRTALYTVLVLDLIAAVMTFSRGGFVALIVAAAMFLKNSRNKLAGIIFLTIGGVLIYMLAPSAWFERVNTINESDSDLSFLGRVVAWKISLLIALDNPLTGGGMHAVQRWPNWLRYRPQLPTVDFFTTPAASELTPKAAHSIYFEVLGDMGFVGLALFLLMLMIGFFYCSRIIKLARSRPDLVWAADLARMAQISLAVYCVSGAALSMAYFEMLYVVLAVVSRTRRIVVQAVTQEKQAKFEAIAQRPGPLRPALGGEPALPAGVSAAYRPPPPGRLFPSGGRRDF